MIRNSKKAQIGTILNWVLYKMTFVIIVAVFFLIIVTDHYRTGLTSRDIENTVMIKRLLNSPDLLAYEDTEIQRIYPGIIDSSKFSTERLESNLLNSNGNVAVSMELTDLDTGKVSTAYINEARAKAWKDYVAIGGFESDGLTRYVKIYDNGKFHQGILRVKVLIRT